MKKLVITLALAGLMSTAYGQGYVAFLNAAATDVYTNSTQNIWGVATGNGGSAVTPTVANGGSFYYALLMQTYSGSGGTVSTSLASIAANGWLTTGLFGTPGLGAGRIAGGNPVSTLSADAIGTGNQFFVLGWSGNVAPGTLAGLTTVEGNLALGSTYAWTLLSGTQGFLGVSAVGTGVGQGVSSPELLYGTGGIAGFQQLYLVPVPEPATFALIGLGGLSLLLFRRRQ
jgi:hypothetical protein